MRRISNVQYLSLAGVASLTSVLESLWQTQFDNHIIESIFMHLFANLTLVFMVVYLVALFLGACSDEKPK